MIVLDTGQRALATASWSRQRGQPGQHRSIVLPGGFAWSTCDDRITQLQGFGLHANGDLGIAIGRLQIDMSQPAPDDIDLHARLK